MKLKLFCILLLTSFSLSKTIDQKLFSEKICDAYGLKIESWKNPHAIAGSLSPSLRFFYGVGELAIDYELTKEQKILVVNLIFDELKLVEAWDGERGESASELFPLIFEKIGDDVLREVLNQVNMETPRKMLVWLGFINDKYPKTHQLLLKESCQFFEAFEGWSLPKQWEKEAK